MAKIIEILQYTLKNGTGTEFHRIMCEISIPLHEKYGIDVVSYGHSLHDADSYYLIRAFESEDWMTTVLDNFYASAEWRNGPREDIVNRIDVSFKSVLLLPERAIEVLHLSNPNGN